MLCIDVTTFLAPPCCCRCGHADDPQGCAEITEVTLFYAIWFTAYSGLTLAVVKRFARMRSLLNPITSGVVTI